MSDIMLAMANPKKFTLIWVGIFMWQWLADANLPNEKT